jgi:hypothetical protein
VLIVRVLYFEKLVMPSGHSGNKSLISNQQSHARFSCRWPDSCGSGVTSYRDDCFEVGLPSTKHCERNEASQRNSPVNDIVELGKVLSRRAIGNTTLKMKDCSEISAEGASFVSLHPPQLGTSLENLLSEWNEAILVA